MEKNFIILNKIYSNNNSQVFKVKEKNTKKIFAMKVIKIKEKIEEFDQISNCIQQECILLSELKNKYVIDIKNYWISNNYINSSFTHFNQKLFKICYLYILMEFFETNLEQFLFKLNKKKFEKKKSGLDYLSLIKISKKLIKGLIYLHKNNVIHRDIKPSNIWIKKENNKYKIKYCDFGISKKINCEENKKYINFFKFDSFKTYLYSSPEQIKSNYYNFSTDIYSLGLIFLQLFYPMKTSSEKIILFKKIKNNNFNFINLLTQEFNIFYLIENMVKINFNKRFNLQFILKYLIFLKKNKTKIVKKNKNKNNHGFRKIKIQSYNDLNFINEIITY